MLIQPDGIAVPETGYHSRDMLDTDTGELSNPYNNPPAGVLLSIVENFVKEPPTPVYLHWRHAAAGNNPLDLTVRCCGKQTAARSDSPPRIRQKSARNGYELARFRCKSF